MAKRVSNKTNPSMNRLSAALAIIHHLLLFGLISILFGQYAILKFRVDLAKSVFLIKLNQWYVFVLVGTVAIGMGRVFYGDKPSLYYLTNVFFWIKIASILALLIYGVKMVGIFKTLHQSASKGNDFQSDQWRQKSYRMVFTQMHLFPIPIIAAVFLAKGY